MARLKNKSTSSKSKKAAKIFDVAEMAGVSIKTVSRVVNNEPNVQEKTREKVLKEIARLNYRPNIAARGLSGKRSYVIGLVYENPHEFSYMKDVLNGALQVCDNAGYSLLLRPLTLPGESLVEDIRQVVFKTGMDGIVLTAPIVDIPEVKSMLSDQDIPYACLAPRDHEDNSIVIQCDDEAASLALTEYVISLGHKRIAFIKGHPDHGASHKRFKGYRAALKKHNLKYESSLVKQGYFDFESGKVAARKLLNMQNFPSAIIASNDDMAAGVAFEGHENGFSIPEDISVVGFDDSPTASHMWPPLTTVRQPITEMAARATELLILQLQGGDVSSQEAAYTCELVIRSSSGPPKVQG